MAEGSTQAAIQWLVRLFGNRAAEEWILKVDVHSIGKELGYAARTIELAAEEIGLRSATRGQLGRASWALPDPPEGPDEGQPGTGAADLQQPLAG